MLFVFKNYQSQVKSSHLKSIMMTNFISLQIILNSMHRFQPRIYLVVRPEGVNHPITDIEQERYRTYIFPETIFTAVTAYQNQLVSLKHKLLFTKCLNLRVTLGPNFLISLLDNAPNHLVGCVIEKRYLPYSTSL